MPVMSRHPATAPAQGWTKRWKMPVVKNTAAPQLVGMLLSKLGRSAVLPGRNRHLFPRLAHGSNENNHPSAQPGHRRTLL